MFSGLLAWNLARPSRAEYLVYEVRGQSGLAMPAVSRRLRLAALRRYPGYSFKRRMFRRLLRAAVWLGIDRLWAKRSAVPHPFLGQLNFSLWIQALRDALHRPDLFPVIHGSVQDERRRVYVHLIDRAGQAIAFAKLALDDNSNAQLESEIKRLQAFQARPPALFRVPKLLLDGQFHGHRYMVLDALPSGASPIDLSWDTLSSCLNELFYARPRLLTAGELCEAKWWRDFNKLAKDKSEKFIDELRDLIGDGLPVERVHGDLGSQNLAGCGPGLWIIDWEESSDIGPRRTDEISHYLARRQRRILHRPITAAHAFAVAFLQRASAEDRRDVMAALAFLAAAGLESAKRIIAQWSQIPKDRAAPPPASVPRPVRRTAGIDIATISNTPTSSRSRLLKRFAAELNGVRVHNVFTHSISDPAMPWRMAISPDLHPVFFPGEHLKSGRLLGSRSPRLFQKIRQYLVTHDIKAIILFGCDDLIRLRLARWARNRGISVFLGGDFDELSAAPDSPLKRTIHRQLLRWTVGSVSAVMPAGSVSRDYLRTLCDHGLPEFPMPDEPDYAALKPAGAAELEQLQSSLGLSPDRRRFLFHGSLAMPSGVHLIVDAFIFASRSLPDWDLIIAGDGVLRDALQARVPPQLASRIRFLGFVPPSLKPACYQACDVLVHPGGRSQARTLVIKEAVASGLAVIAAGTSSDEVDLVCHQTNGLRVEPGSLAALAAAMVEVAQGDAYLGMKQASAEILRTWRRQTDPVQGLRMVLRNLCSVKYEDAQPATADDQSTHEHLPAVN